MNRIEVYETKPLDFKSIVDVAACYIEIDGRCLFLERAHGKLEERKWGVPAGKREENRPLA